MSINTLPDLESKISKFTVRVGANTAQRLDLESAEAPEDDAPEIEKPTFNLDIHLKPNSHAIRVDVDLRVEDEYARYRTVVSGQWFSEDESAFEALIEPADPVLDELIMTTLAPQILAVAQAKITDLSRGIECPPVLFPYNLSVELRKLRTQAKGAPEETSEEAST